MKIWQFMEVVAGSSSMWSWRVLGPGGNLEATSEPQRNYGVAVTDAIQHGFLPSNDHWVVITTAGVTRFEPAGSRTPLSAAKSRSPRS